MVGFNYRMTDIQAAVGREQLKRLPAHRRAPARAGRALHARAARRPGVTLPRRAGLGAQQLAELRVRARAAADQRAVMQAMLDAASRPAAAS